MGVDESDFQVLATAFPLSNRTCWSSMRGTEMPLFEMLIWT